MMIIIRVYQREEIFWGILYCIVFIQVFWGYIGYCKYVYSYVELYEDSIFLVVFNCVRGQQVYLLIFGSEKGNIIM